MFGECRREFCGALATLRRLTLLSQSPSWPWPLTMLTVDRRLLRPCGGRTSCLRSYRLLPLDARHPHSISDTGIFRETNDAERPFAGRSSGIMGIFATSETTQTAKCNANRAELRIFGPTNCYTEKGREHTKNTNHEKMETARRLITLNYARTSPTELN